MAKYTVRRRVDAYAIYETEVEAESPSEATQKADLFEADYNWGEAALATFDARSYVALNAEGHEIEETERGDL